MPKLILPEYKVTIDGREYTTGCLKRESRCGEVQGAHVWTGIGEPCPIVPRDQWRTQQTLEAYEWDDVDQDGYPACTLASLANAGEFHLARTGRDKTRLDWHKLWVILSGGVGGVALDSALRYVLTKGFPLLDEDGVLKPAEVWDIPTVAAAYSALMRAGTLWYGRFVGRGGHAECGLTLNVENGVADHDVRGTWGKDYGNNGWYPQRITQADIDAFGAFAFREWELRPRDLAA